MRRPVWLFSMDTEQFCAPPMTTGALKACFLARGRSAGETDVDLVHFLERDEVASWEQRSWADTVAPRARAALAAGVQPVFGLSCYTWNVAEFLALGERGAADVPGALVVAGGPHVQRAEDFLGVDAIDVVVLGEGEETFTELLDAPDRSAWPDIVGLAFLDEEGSVQRTGTRARTTVLDTLPSALDLIPLRDVDGEPIYQQIAYETSRGCPYRCAFCEWGTGAIGTKMFQFSLDRIRHDLELAMAGGIKDIWLCDSNFGALREDLAKAQLVIELREKTGLPRTFATSWSKNHNKRVQEVVRLLHRHGLLSHYHLALQTLTPRALELSHRTNMRANDYEPVVKSLAAEGVPVAAELIWGLPGDTLAEFETNLDQLMTVFPNVNIFGYTLLPGTEFHDRRDELELETIPVAGYGKAKGEYVVGCLSFPRDEGEEGYFLITAYIVLGRGQVMPLVAQYLALTRRVGVGRLLRATLRALLTELADILPKGLASDRMAAYESRSALFCAFLAHPERSYPVIARVVADELRAQGAADLIPGALRVLELDQAFHPRHGEKHVAWHRFGFAADRVERALSGMQMPEAGWLSTPAPLELVVEHPGGVGAVLRDPDGGAWGRGRVARRAA
jgi:hypothetical protein